MLSHRIAREQIEGYYLGKFEIASQTNKDGVKRLYGVWNPKTNTIMFHVVSSSGVDYVWQFSKMR